MKKIPGKRFDLSRGFSDAEGDLNERYMTINTERKKLQEEVYEINKKLKLGGLSRAERAKLCNHYHGKCKRLKVLKAKIEKHAELNRIAVQCFKSVADEETFYAVINKAKTMQKEILDNTSGWDSWKNNSF